MKNIHKFCETTGFIFKKGQIGFDRDCVGIIDPSTDSYVAYSIYDDQYNVLFTCTAKRALDAYHKGDYLAVLGHSDSSVKQLDEWVNRIMEQGFIITLYTDHTTLSFFAGRPITAKAVIDKKVFLIENDH